MTNTELVERYPFLALRNAWTGNIIEDYDPERDGTYLDEMPQGWKIAFGEQMCEELRNELLRWDCLNDYRILQVKEKYGTLCWYDNGIPFGIWSEQYIEIPIADWQQTGWFEAELKWPHNEFYKEYVYDDDKNVIAVHIHRYLDRCKVYDIIEKYEDISGRICAKCGKPATKISRGWICPWCDDHIGDSAYWDINEYYSKN